jgi:hypothetical protein
MNYTHLNQTHEYWRNNIFPHLIHNFPTVSFDDYLRKFAHLPHGKWIKDMEKVKMNRIPIAFDPESFVKNYKKHCVTYNAPVKPEEGWQRVIYQMSPTLHVEFAFWVWVEHNEVQSYGTAFACYHAEKEYLDFVDELWKIRREGNTEEKYTAGFKINGDTLGIFPKALDKPEG